jgi:hypothetical protein
MCRTAFLRVPSTGPIRPHGLSGRRSIAAAHSRTARMPWIQSRLPVNLTSSWTAPEASGGAFPAVLPFDRIGRRKYTMQFQKRSIWEKLVCTQLFVAAESSIESPQGTGFAWSASPGT